MARLYTLAEAHEIMRHRQQRRWAPAQPDRPELTTWRVLMHVAQRSGITVRQLRGSHRARGFAAARALAARVLRVVMRATFEEVAGALGYADASSAQAATARADGARAEAIGAELATLYRVSP